MQDNQADPDPQHCIRYQYNTVDVQTVGLGFISVKDPCTSVCADLDPRLLSGS
jgi:hypothetical protein